ncbi:MAG: DUF4932 domain-containing protein [Candidatus Fermentithermobacillus carboniphilus]|uniref:DUF4932 domain-containing protein n=1 Tax=Candidatus Fermentithermobacillus carboniphilus TaxID=3085328 RepID=A0AAT9LF95_9FIRM|nr:MAG: DUF4932 domain-containing protein [Candidatus Fermentithermobacillus carboniphilus]
MFWVWSPGHWYTDSPDFPSGRSLETLTLHELGHSFVNPAMDMHSARVSGLGELFKPVERQMRDMAYPNVHVFMNEQVLRAVTSLAAKVHRFRTRPSGQSREIPGGTRAGSAGHIIPEGSRLAPERGVPCYRHSPYTGKPGAGAAEKRAEAHRVAVPDGFGRETTALGALISNQTAEARFDGVSFTQARFRWGKALPSISALALRPQSRGFPPGGGIPR